MSNQKNEARKKARQALVVWVLFFASTVAINLLIPLVFGFNLHDWSFSTVKGLLLFSVDYAGFFLILPLFLTKGCNTFKKPTFAIPVAVAAISVIFWQPIPYIAAIALAIYVYLHLKFNLSELGFRSKGWKGDVAAIILVGTLGLLQALASSSVLQITLLPALSATAFRMFANPASTVENLFYYGFLTDRVGQQLNRYAVPFLIGTMYTLHEMSNPAYWYESMPFAFVFIGVTLFAAVYLWRKNIVVTWLSDGFQWFLTRLI